MITAEQQHDWLRHQLDADGHNTPCPDWLDQLRTQAGKTAVSLPPLDRKTEAWRYTSVENLLKQNFTPATEKPLDIDAVRDQLSGYLVNDTNCCRIIMVNGYFVEELSDTNSLPDGITLASIRDLLINDPDVLANWFGQAVMHTREVFTALNTALMDDGIFIRVEANVKPEQPIEVVYLTFDETHSLSLQPRNLVLIEQGASATLIERFVGSKQSAPCFHNLLSEIIVGNNASLEHYRIQEENNETYHLSNVYISQQHGSRYHGTTLAFGGRWNRTEYHTMFRAENAECSLNGLSVVADRQLSDFHLNVLHTMPECVSRERFKSIIHGKGRAVFDGYIRVERNAQHSDAQLTSNNLLLTRDGEIDTKPQLEIYADDVRCSHGSTVGELDAQQIFYLRSRGIDEKTARSILCLGFANDIINTVKPSALRDYSAEKLKHVLMTANITTGLA